MADKSMENNVFTSKLFDLSGRVAIITGGAGLLGIQHAEAIAEFNGNVILWDINEEDVEVKANDIAAKFNVKSHGMVIDITIPKSVEKGLEDVLATYHKVDILINNAAHDPKVNTHHEQKWSHLEHFHVDMWEKDLNVGLTGAFLCSKAVGGYMANHGGGVILNIASDLGVIAPDQRIYRQPNLSEDRQPKKPVSYSVVKHGLIGLTKYLATYWSDKGVRVNALSPGGVYDNQSDTFLTKIKDLIPMGRMAHKDEYKGAVIFLCSDASSYMTGANLIVDGGRTCW